MEKGGNANKGVPISGEIKQSAPVNDIRILWKYPGSRKFTGDCERLCVDKLIILVDHVNYRVDIPFENPVGSIR